MGAQNPQLEQILTRVETPFVPPLSKATLPVVLAQSGVPFIVAPTGTITAAGVITLGTALPATYPNCFLYLPAGAAAPGSSAGWYFAQMTSTTVGQLFTGTNGAASYSSGPVLIPGSAALGNGTAIPAVGSNYTGVTGAVTGPQITIPAGAMGNQSILRISSLFAANANINTKTVGFTLGGSTVVSQALTTAAQFGLASVVDIIGRPQQVAASPVNEVAVTSPAGGLGILAAASTYLSVNMGANQVLAFTLNDATATDFSILEAFTVELLNTSNLGNA